MSYTGRSQEVDFDQTDVTLEIFHVWFHGLFNLLAKERPTLVFQFLSRLVE
jgi:hypothetical protein